MSLQPALRLVRNDDAVKYPTYHELRRRITCKATAKCFYDEPFSRMTDEDRAIIEKLLTIAHGNSYLLRMAGNVASFAHNPQYSADPAERPKRKPRKRSA